MKKYEFNFSCTWVYDKPVKNHHFLLRCMPGTYPFQRTYAHSLSLSPSAGISEGTDSYGNTTYSGSIDKGHSSFGFAASGFVLCSKYMIREPLDRLFLYPSRMTEPSETMSRFVFGLDLPEPSYERAVKIMSAVNALMSYTPGGTEVYTTAAQAFEMAQGVSRDFVQVFITLCRMCKIPARYVIGLAKGVSRAHVWAEVYADNMWRALDPMLNVQVEEGYLKFAHGLDYSDCPVDRYSYQGEGVEITQTKTITARVSDHIITSRDTVPRK